MTYLFMGAVLATGVFGFCCGYLSRIQGSEILTNLLGMALKGEVSWREYTICQKALTLAIKKAPISPKEYTFWKMR